MIQDLVMYFQIFPREGKIQIVRKSNKFIIL